MLTEDFKKFILRNRAQFKAKIININQQVQESRQIIICHISHSLEI